jgi:hypothetical protein
VSSVEYTAPVLLDPTAGEWLREMAYAAALAKVHLDQAELAVRTTGFLPYAAPQGGDLDLATCRPTAAVTFRHQQAVHKAERAAAATYREVVGWYAQSAALALEGVLAGRAVTAGELEARTLLRILVGDRPASDGDVWPDRYRPPLRTPDVLATGHEDLDRPVREAYEPLAAAYRAEDLAAVEADFESRPDGYIADWEAGRASDAAERARPVWILLHTWAEALSFAAAYGRSPARGHGGA